MSRRVSRPPRRSRLTSRAPHQTSARLPAYPVLIACSPPQVRASETSTPHRSVVIATVTHGAVRSNDPAEHAPTGRADKRLSWQDLADGTGLSVVFVTAALLGQHPLPADAASSVADKLGLDTQAARLLQAIPMRGSIPGGVPTDPTTYRFYEMLQVYVTTLRALVHEQFGDGIISAINFNLDIKKVPDPDGGERAVITLDGQVLAYEAVLRNFDAASAQTGTTDFNGCDQPPGRSHETSSDERSMQGRSTRPHSKCPGWHVAPLCGGT